MTCLVLELLTEELPPKSLQRLSDFFVQKIFTGLQTQGFLSANSVATPIATPRRLGVLISDVTAESPEQKVTEKILPISIALDAQGQATAVLEKKIAALSQHIKVSFSWRDCVRAPDGKTEALFYTFSRPGVPLNTALQILLTETLAQMPVAKVMQYQLPIGQSVSFVRPAHRLLAMWGSETLSLRALGLESANLTEGHRFLCPTKPLIITHADHYLTLLRAAFVEPLWEARREQINQALDRAAQAAKVIKPNELLDEVCALVEWPSVYSCTFDEAFLEIPQECLILTMQQNQKYFVLKDANNQLLPRFLVVSNIQTDDPFNIIKGNEKVVRPRLADAAFFYQQDQKISLSDREKQLSETVYHQKLGSQAERTLRIVQISQTLFQLVNPNDKTTTVHHLTRAAALCKTDLRSEMVAEFPELQGIMGGYYATLAGENSLVTNAITEHYCPKFALDDLPTSDLGCLLSLSDKLESLIGFWGVGVRASGEKDPFALRRLALAICRLFVEKKLPVSFDTILDTCSPAFSGIKDYQLDQKSLKSFLMDRLRSYLKEKGYSTNLIEAVLVVNPDPLFTVIPKIEGLINFLNTPSAGVITTNYKRINNILSKATALNLTVDNFVDKKLFDMDAEVLIWENYLKLVTPYQNFIQKHQFNDALQLILTLEKPIEQFFNDVMVFTSDISKQKNRLALLNKLRELLNAIADLSILSL